MEEVRRVEMSSDQRLNRVRMVLDQLVKTDEFMTGQVGVGSQTPYDLRSIRFARQVLEAALGNDPKPGVVFDAVGRPDDKFFFDLSGDSGQARMTGGNK